MEHLDTFLARQPPFDGIDPDGLRELAAQAREQAYAEGEVALVEDGPPAAWLWLILEGSMELVHDGEVIQVLEPGECFGHPSLLSGLAPTFTVRARQPARCALLPADVARRLLGTQAGAAYVATTMRTRLTGTGHTVHGLLDLGTVPVASIMRPAVFIAAETDVREAARQLGQPGISALLVALGDATLGILTDSEIRAAVVAGESALDAPVRTIARSPVPTVPVEQLAIEATIEMLAAHGGHLAVLDGERVCGLVSATDLLSLETRSPIALRHLILGAADEDELVRAVAQLPKLFALLVRAGVPARDLGRVLSLQHDAVVGRLIDFSLTRHGEAPSQWAWLDLGSAARREFTLASDQDNAFAYDDAPPNEAEAIDAYFARLGSEVNNGLARCGIGSDNNGVMAGKRLWRMSKSDWLRTFDECLTQPDESHLIRATVSFDFRPAAGGLAVAPELTERIRAAREYPAFMRLMARSASGFPVALGFRGQLATGKHGEPPGRLDLKHGAIIPLVNLVRFHALANGVTISSTLDRLEAVASVGGLSRGEAGALSEAFSVITRLRFEHHEALIAAGQAPDNLVDPQSLTPIATAELREALQVVRKAQKQLGVWGGTGR
jgi:CBS domain-containing protein